jgi:hypothetical protein
LDKCRRWWVKQQSDLVTRGAISLSNSIHLPASELTIGVKPVGAAAWPRKASDVAAGSKRPKNGCITTCWQLRSPTSSLASLGQFSTKGARSNIRRSMRWRPLLNPHLPASRDQETTSGHKQRNSYIRTKCIATKFRCSITSLEVASTGRQFGRFNSPSCQQLCMHTPCENRQPERLLQCRTSDLETLCTDNCGSLPYGKLLDAL